MSNVIIVSTKSRRRPIGFQSHAESPGRSATNSKRALLLLVVLATALLLAGCTDHLDITGLPVTCRDDQSGKDVAARVVVEVSQTGAGVMQRGTKIVNSKGVAEFMIGSSKQSKRLLMPGHRPENAPLNVIYTADPVSIGLRFKEPCKVNTKTKTVVLDDLPQQKKKGRITYTLPYADF